MTTSATVCLVPPSPTAALPRPSPPQARSGNASGGQRVLACVPAAPAAPPSAGVSKKLCSSWGRRAPLLSPSRRVKSGHREISKGRGACRIRNRVAWNPIQAAGGQGRTPRGRKREPPNGSGEEMGHLCAGGKGTPFFYLSAWERGLVRLGLRSPRKQGKQEPRGLSVTNVVPLKKGKRRKEIKKRPLA